MKRVLLYAAFITCITLQACNGGGSSKPGAKTDAPATPEAVMSAFNSKYPGVTDVKWKEQTDSTRTLYDAEFTNNGKKTEARFDDAGNFVDEK